jgi:hypothetical protein
VRRLSRRIAPWAAGAALLVFGASVVRGEDAKPAPAPPALPPAPRLPDGVVARVGDRDLSVGEFRLILAKRARAEMSDQNSGPFTVLQILIQETVVRQEAERLGIRVTSDDYGRRYDEIDRQVRERSGGAQTLADVVKLQRLSPEEFRARLEDVIRKERIASHPTNLGEGLPKDERAKLAQIEVVIGQVIQRAKVERDDLPPGIAARVGGEPITDAQFGKALQMRLAESEVRRHLQEHCLTLLLEHEGLGSTPAQVDAALEEDRPLWERMRVDAIDPQRQAISFDDFLLLLYGTNREELRSNPYRRGLFALRQRKAAEITEDDVRAAWVRGKATEYGPSVVATEVLLSFKIPNAVVEKAPRRTREEALRLANDVLRRIRGGEPADAVLKEIREKKDPSFVVKRRAIMARENDRAAVERDNDRPLWDALATLQDGEWSAPIETLSEVHLVRRETLRPAPTYEEIKAVVRGRLVDEKAQSWLQDAMRDRVVLARP